ncbi:MAG: ABC transporter permease [Dongiaceae bacterium]
MSMSGAVLPSQRHFRRLLFLVLGLVLTFLILPLFIILPLSFTDSRILTFPPTGWSDQWYVTFFTDDAWLVPLKNSLIVGGFTTVIATVLGTLAALGLVRAEFRGKALIMALLISPMVVPIVITAVGLFFFYAWLGVVGTYFSLILGHTVLAMPFVVITVSAALQGFDRTLLRAGSSLGGRPFFVFFHVTLPLILPAVVAGAIFAFATSFDEVVVALFLATPEQRTLPRQIFAGIRENISPTIAAAATVLILVSIVMMGTMEYLRRRSERLRGVRPS